MPQQGSQHFHLKHFAFLLKKKLLKSCVVVLSESLLAMIVMIGFFNSSSLCHCLDKPSHSVPQLRVKALPLTQ